MGKTLADVKQKQVYRARRGWITIIISCVHFVTSRPEKLAEPFLSSRFSFLFWKVRDVTALSEGFEQCEVLNQYLFCPEDVFECLLTVGRLIGIPAPTARTTNRHPLD